MPITILTVKQSITDLTTGTVPAGSVGWPFPMLQYKYIFKQNIWKQLYQMALGNCYGVKLVTC